jgi:hypothetical protein
MEWNSVRNIMKLELQRGAVTAITQGLSGMMAVSATPLRGACIGIDEFGKTDVSALKYWVFAFRFFCAPVMENLVLISKRPEHGIVWSRVQISTFGSCPASMPCFMRIEGNRSKFHARPRWHRSKCRRYAPSGTFCSNYAISFRYIRLR